MLFSVAIRSFLSYFSNNIVWAWPLYALKVLIMWAQLNFSAISPSRLCKNYLQRRKLSSPSTCIYYFLNPRSMLSIVKPITAPTTLSQFLNVGVTNHGIYKISPGKQLCRLFPTCIWGVHKRILENSQFYFHQPWTIGFLVFQAKTAAIVRSVVFSDFLFCPCDLSCSLKFIYQLNMHQNFLIRLHS